jgi:RNAse (barnase) inhibitor barstar
MAIVHLDGAGIGDWMSFHDACQVAFGFPDFYGRNMNAWVDCLSYLRDDEGMSKFRLLPNEMLQIEISDSASLRARAPEIIEEMEFCIAAINDRYEDYGEKPALALSLR